MDTNSDLLFRHVFNIENEEEKTSFFQQVFSFYAKTSISSHSHIEEMPLLSINIVPSVLFVLSLIRDNLFSTDDPHLVIIFVYRQYY